MLWADDTGYVTEPARAVKMNLALAYTSSDGTRSATAFYAIRTRRNDDLSFVGTDGPCAWSALLGSRSRWASATGGLNTVILGIGYRF